MSGFGLLSFPLLGTVTDASGNPHPAYHDGKVWQPLGQVVLGTATVTADVVCPAGQTVPVATVVCDFVGLADSCEIVLDCPSVHLTSTSGGAASLSVTAGGSTYILGAVTADRQIGWPARMGRIIPAPGAGTQTLTVQVASTSGGVTLHADNDAAYGPIVVEVAAFDVQVATQSG